MVSTEEFFLLDFLKRFHFQNQRKEKKKIFFIVFGEKSTKSGAVIP